MTRSGRGWGRLIVIAGLATPAAHCAGCGSSVMPSDASSDAPVFDVLIDTTTTSDVADAGVTDPCSAATAAHDGLGCDYVVFNALADQGTSTACTALLIANPGTTAAHLALSYKGSALNLSSALQIVSAQGLPFSYSPAPNADIPPGATAVLFALEGVTNPLFPSEKCAFPAANNLDLTAHVGSTSTAMALHATAPVFATYAVQYGLDPEIVQERSTTTPLRALSSWDVRYRDVGLYMAGSPGHTTDCCGNTYATLPQLTSLTAQTIGSLSFPSIDGGSQVVPTQMNEVLSYVGADTLIGRQVKSTTPFSLWSNSVGWFMPYVDGSVAYNGNMVVHNIAPPSAWGHAYATAPYPPRYNDAADPPIWRIVGDVNGTTLSYGGTAPAGAPSSIDAGKLAVFSTSTAFTVTSQDAQHPFYLDEIMPSCSAIKSCTACAQDDQDGGYTPFDCRGAPTVVSVQPPEEFSTHAVFMTNPNLPEVWLVVVREKQTNAYADVTLDCAGTLSAWNDIDEAFQYTYVALSRGNFEPQTYAGGTCALGPHTLDSAAPFGVVVWAWGTPAATPPPDDAGIHEGPLRAAYAFPVLGRGPHVFPQRPITN